MDTLQKAKGFLFFPKNSFDAEKKTNMKEAIKYLLAIQLVFAIGSSIVMIFSGSTINRIKAGACPELTAAQCNSASANILIPDFAFGYIGGILLVLIAALWMHLWMYVFGGKNGFEQTIKAAIYGITPASLLGWVPWSIFREYIGFASTSELTLNTATERIIFALGPISFWGILLVGIWSLALFVVGLKNLQKIGCGRAAIAVIASVFSAIYLVLRALLYGAPVVD